MLSLEIMPAFKAMGMFFLEKISLTLSGRMFTLLRLMFPVRIDIYSWFWSKPNR